MQGQFMQLHLKMAARWLPNIEEFFESLYQCIIGAQQHLNSRDRNDNDYWLRRVLNYESIVNSLLTRMRASSGESSLVENMVLLVQYISSVRGQLIALSPQTHANSNSQQETLRPNILHAQNPGRPMFSVNMDDVSRLRSLGFSWNDLSSLFGISSRTLRRRRLESGISVMSYDNITNVELDNIVRDVLEITPQAGRNLVRGALQSRGVHVQRRVEESIARVDPVVPTLRNNREIIRRRYSVPCPNFLW